MRRALRDAPRRDWTPTLVQHVFIEAEALIRDICVQEVHPDPERPGYYESDGVRGRCSCSEQYLRMLSHVFNPTSSHWVDKMTYGRNEDSFDVGPREKVKSEHWFENIAHIDARRS